MEKLRNYIDGRWSVAERDTTVVSPVTGEAFANVPLSREGEVGEAVAAAKRAFAGWSKLAVAERCAVVRKCAEWLSAQYGQEGVVTDIKREIMDAIGKPLPEADIEVLESAGMIEYFCEIGPGVLEARQIVVNQSLWPSKESSLFFEPVGVVGVIKPWNYPLETPVWAIAPALIAGNTVVLKPSEKSPTVGLLFGRMAEAIGLPAGVLNVVAGDRDTGRMLVVHPDVAMVSFTGSVAAGKWIAEECGKRLKRVTLELGGNDAALVLDDADVELAANGVVWGAFCNAGQVCVGVKRAFVTEGIAQKFISVVLEKTKALRSGIDVGPIVDEEQLRTVEEFVKDSVAKGAKVLTGGRRIPGTRGLFYEPTVLVDVDGSMKIMTEECFGPVLPIVTVGNARDAIGRANDSRYGLGASVWTSDLSSGMEVARELKAGMVWVNDVNVAFAEAPWGGVKESGQGFELSPDCLLEYVVRKHVSVEKATETRRVWWYPYGQA